MAHPTQKSNRLIHAASPYLLQHAYNPVEWFEWGHEALEKASHEDKPILVSIGYSSCHWCHVMERESFENEDIAAIMNEHFVCIKVDREERPDLDHLYMEAVQAMGINGGWPLNVFLTPSQKPFYGGTYFPPQGWAQLLQKISKAFQQSRNEINQSADELSKHLSTSDLQQFAKEPTGEVYTTESVNEMANLLASQFDRQWGGMEKAPKFVMPTIWLFLLRHHTLSKNKNSLDMVVQTLTQMAKGGLFDQVGGGFARYSVDAQWFAPHFEKMLYDNAQLLSLYAEAYSATKNQFFKTIIYKTTTWLQREMTHTEGGFYSALDADSEGEEGKFYTWTLNEFKDSIGSGWEMAGEYYQVTERGNWEHGRNILHVADRQRVLNNHHLTEQELDIQIETANEKLLEARSHRIRPGLDDKIITGWNAMMVKGLTDAYRALGDEKFLKLALSNIVFLETGLFENGKYYRTFKDKHGQTEAFLEDYAFLIQAYTALYQVTFNETWLNKAEQWCRYVLDNFFDETDGYFHLASKNAEQLIARKKEIFDNVIPASNSVMARNLFHLGIMLDQNEWKDLAIQMCSQLATLTKTEPGYMSNWATLFAEVTKGMTEIVIVGAEAQTLSKALHQYDLPFTVTLGTTTVSNLPLLKDRQALEGKTTIYVCQNKSCKLPVTSVADALRQIN